MGTQILICVLFSILINIYGKHERIIGGYPAEKETFPYLVSFRVTQLNQHVCAGTIITTRSILTAAHCVYKKDKYFHLVTIHIGTANVSDVSGSVHTIKKAIPHPQFIGQPVGNNGFHNDVAVVICNEEIEMNEFQNQIRLASRSPAVGSEVILCGWGVISFPEQEFPVQVQYIHVQIVKRQQCMNKFEFPILPDQICSHGEGIGACIGDSGGPVIRNNEVVGIISFSKPCATDAPDIHTDVFTHRKFIISTITANE